MQVREVDLPKYPKMSVTGESVSREQAKQMIFALDDFIATLGTGGYTNDHEWADWAKKLLRQNRPVLMVNTYMEVLDKTKLTRSILFDYRKAKRVETTHFGVEWSASCFIGGPRGWIDPSGEIKFEQNIGKYPDVQEVYDDLLILGKKWPNLKLTVSLVIELRDDVKYEVYGHKHATTLTLEDGLVLQSPIPEGDDSYKDLHFHDLSELLDFDRITKLQKAFHIKQHGNREMPEGLNVEARMKWRMMDDHKRLDAEHGLPDSWLVDYAREHAWPWLRKWYWRCVAEHNKACEETPLKL